MTSDEELRRALDALIADVQRVLALDPGYRGGEWNTALAALDGSADAAGAVLAARPKDGVWVTEETLAAAITATHWYDASSKDALHEAAAILRHLREGT